MSTAEKLRAEGRVEGRAEGRVEVVLKLLALRYGVLPDAATARVRGATQSELDGFTERVLSAATLDACLSDPR